jgi:hypothetical protein
MSKLFFFLLVFFVARAFALGPLPSPEEDSSRFFSGRISRTNTEARLIRVRTDFANIKFLNRSDRIEFWNESYPASRCRGFVEGRTNDYLLVRIPDMGGCIRTVHFATGSYLHFESPDLNHSVDLAKDVVAILQKKRLAIQAKKNRHQRDLDGHVDKVDTVNKRYEILRQKLEIEWQKELAALEEDKARTYAEFKNSEARLNEIDTKLEAYRIEDNNLKIDRWSLDPALYIRK